MNVLSRLLMLLAVLFLSSLYLLPLWQISLFAPQYPDGVTMYIYIDKLGGETPGTLQNVNILNHYVGMKLIDPESIPELKYFPIVIGIMIALGLLFTFMNKRKGYLSWVIIMVVLSVLGFYDFYLWEYDYGHSLSPNAPIKIPGASFQPPLFGWKTIINFEAYSGPQLGGWFAGCSIICAFLAYLLYRKPRSEGVTTKKVEPAIGISSILLLLVLASSCQIEPDPMYYGEDVCAACKMTIVDQQHAAQLVTTKGKVFKYDAIECMLSAKEPDNSYEHILVSNYLDPGAFIDARDATFVISESIPSPMGANLSAVPSPTEVDGLLRDRGGDVFSWEEIKKNRITPEIP
jgi:copper chaperone NosL